VAPLVDLYATSARRALDAAGADGLNNVILSQWAASGRALAEALPAAQCRYAVSFVGAAYGNRRRWIAALARRGIEVQCFGHGWPNGPVSTQEVRRIARESVISLNFADSSLQWRGLRPHRDAQIKARTFEVPGAGGFLLTEAVAGLSEYYRPGEEIDVFRSEEELIEKIQAYLGSPARRDAACRAGHERTRREHTYEKRFAPLLEDALRRAAKPLKDSPEPVGGAHDVGPALRLLRLLLVLPATLMFGVRRGPRAARRLLFELSWRVAGEHTYSARGWPGRLFYRES
jgi:spore maturation protein CgeB